MLLIIGAVDTLKVISIEAYFASIGRFYNRFRHLSNVRSVFSIMKNVKMRIYEKKGKKAMRGNLNDEQKEQLKVEDKKRKKK